ncbi:MAG: hypothetical protein AAB780_01805 [Patescibacteria group bacterium]
MVGDIAHICNRGVDKRIIFNSEADYCRFRDNLFLLNNSEGKLRTKQKNIFHNPDLPERDKLVEVLKWSLMPNHFHLLLYEIKEGGILEFTKRVGNAYTKYFNLKNKRSGYLFQNSSKIIPVLSEQHFPYIPIYIDLNAADLISGTAEKKLSFIKSYQWSSLKNYCNEEYDDEVINKELFLKTFEIKLAHYDKDLEGFIEDKGKMEAELEGVNLPR